MRSRVPHVLTLLLAIVVASALLTWVVPSGAYERARVVVDGVPRTVVVPGTFQVLPKLVTPDAALVGGTSSADPAAPVGLLGLLAAVPRGVVRAGDVVALLLVLGATFGILQRTGVIGGVIDLLTRRFGDLGPMLVAVLAILLGAAGSTLGMGPELIPLVPAFVLMARELGFDRLFGLAMLALPSMVGYAAGTTNPFTVAVAQGIAEVPIASGLGLRGVFFAVVMVVTLGHLLRYGARVKDDPRASLVPEPTGRHEVPPLVPYERRHGGVLLACLAALAGLLYGVVTLAWGLAELGGGLLGVGLVAAVAGGLSGDETLDSALRGVQRLLVPALVVGMARAVVVVLEDGRILDTLVHGASLALSGQGPVVGAWGMLAFQAVVNVVVPSGAAQATVTMPLMTPLADVLGLTRQVAVFAFQCGDGLSNLIIPTSGTLMGMLALADVPYDRWLRFVGPLVLQLFALAAVFLALAVLGGWR